MALALLFHISVGFVRLGVMRLFLLSLLGSFLPCSHGKGRTLEGGWKCDGGEDDHGIWTLLDGGAWSWDAGGRSGYVTSGSALLSTVGADWILG
jgi:hypothetical protein